MTQEQLEKTVAEVEELHLSKRPLKLECEDSIVPTDLREFIIWFVEIGRMKYKTLYVDSGETQCFITKSRSTGDMFIIAHHYTNCTFTEFVTELIKTHKEKKVCTLHCPNVQKRVWFCSGNDSMEKLYDFGTRNGIEKATNNLTYADLTSIYEYSTKKEEQLTEA